MNHKPVDIARKGSEVCIKIEPTPGDAPKLYGRHFDLEDMLVSKVNHHRMKYIPACVCGWVDVYTRSLLTVMFVCI